MKKIMNLVSFVGLFAALLTYASCGSKPVEVLPVTDQQLQKLLLTTETSGAVTSVWTLTSTSLDGVDKTTDYTTNFKLTLKGTIGSSSTSPFSYETTNPGNTTIKKSPWNSTGSFTFDAASPANKVIRDDKTEVTYQVSETQLKLNFNFTGGGYDRNSRTEVVKGAWEFVFKK